MPPFSINPVQPLDFRYPGAFNLNQSAKLPSSFGPPDMASMFQSGISGLADPIVARMKEDQARAELAKGAAEKLAAFGPSYAPTAATPGGTGGTAGGTAMPGAVPGARASASSADVHESLAKANPEVRDTFMNTVKANGLTNPYGLAAVAATGQAETNWSPGRVNTAWNDLGKPSGGTLSWRAERLQAMRNFTRGADDPVSAQAQFFIKENPQLIAALNEAKSPEEANRLMANAWRYKGYNQPGAGEFARREALTRQYASQMAPAAPPPPAPTASFAPQVAPAPTPAAAASVTAPQAPQQAPQFKQPNVGHADYQRAIYDALNRGDKQKASELAAERDMVAAQGGTAPQQQQAAAPQQAGRRYTADARADLAPEIAAAQTGSPEAINALARAAKERDRAIGAPQHQIDSQSGFPTPQAQGAAPGPQSQQQQSPAEQQQAQQQQVLQTVGQAADQQSQRLEDTRQQGQRMRVASISPQLPGGLGGGGQAPPGQIERIFNEPQPQQQPLPRPPSGQPQGPIERTFYGQPQPGEPSVFSPEPMVPPQFAARPPTPAPSPAASAPAAPAGPSGPPPQQPAGVPPPYQVAQAQGLPPVVSVPQQQPVRPFTREQARVLLESARTPQEQNQIALMLWQQQQAAQQQAAPTPNRFKIENGHWIDTLTGETKPLTAGGYREMTSAERQKFAVPENTGAFIGPDGKPHVLPGTSSTKIQVTPEAKGEEKYNEEQAKSVRKRFDTLVEEGEKAARAKLDLNTLSEVFARTGQQGSAANFKTTVGPYLEAAGINVTGLSDAQVVQSVVERMAPQQRVVGSGQQSDAEYKGFLRSLPTLMQSPEARQQVLSMLQSQNDIAMRKAQIIADHDEGNIDRKTALQQIRALPGHEAVFQQFKQQNKDLYQQGQRDAGARKDSGNPEDLRKAQQGGPGTTKANPVPVASDAAALRLNPGTWFRLPNGRTGVVEE